MTEHTGDPLAMRDAAQRIDEAGNAIHALQTMLTRRIADVTREWSPETTSDFMRSYLSFDRDISRIQTSLEDLHATLATPCVRARAGLADAGVQ